MPLAQNYKDDVSLLESEAVLAKANVAQDPNRRRNDDHIFVSTYRWDSFFLILH